MDRIQNISQEILEQVKAGQIGTGLALHILKELKEIKESKRSDTKTDNIAVIGIACKFPGAKNKQEYWHNLRNGVCSVGPLPMGRKNDLDHLLRREGKNNEQPFAIAGYLDEIDKFDPAFFKLSPKEAAYIHPIHRIFLETAYEAIEDAGYGGDKIYNTRTGVYVGIDHTTEFDYSRYFGEKDLSLIIGSYSGILASRTSYVFNLRGPALVIDTACSSGLVAVHEACQALIHHECDMAIAGGINLFLYRYKGELAGVESEDSVGRAFDKNGNGTVWGEGVGVVFLKPLANALEDGDNVYGIIVGSAINNDGASNGVTAPNAEAQTELLLQAWNNANIDPVTISYIETHGTGTVLGDPIEIKGLTDAFKQYTEKRQFCAIGSVKNNIGHTIGASGLASLIKVLLSCSAKEMPPNINFAAPNPFINFLNSPIYVNDKLKPWPSPNSPRRAGVNAFGFSGTNCHILLEEAPQRKKSAQNQGEMYLLALSAQYLQGIIELAKNYQEFILHEPDLNINDLCFTANTGRGHYSHRLMLLFSSRNDLQKKLARIIAAESLESASLKDIYFSKHKIVSSNKKECAAGKSTEDEIRALTRSINAKLKELDRNDERAYQTVLTELCLAYVKGANIDWSEFYKEQTYQKVSLPTYPFRKKRYWVEFPVRTAAEIPGKEIEHPFLDQWITDSLDGVIYNTRFSALRHWALNEHRINGYYVAPGTVFLEMAHELGRQYYPGQNLEFQEVVFLNPLVVSKETDKDVQTTIRWLDDSRAGVRGFEFTVASRLGGEWIKHAEGKVYPLAGKSSSKPDVFELKQRGRKRQVYGGLAHNAHMREYAYDAKNKVEVGPRWNVLQEIFYGENELLAYLIIPEEYQHDLSQYYLHPSLMDCAVNAAIRMIGEGLYLPWTYRSMKVYHRIPGQFYSYLHRKDQGKKNAEVGVFDITLLDEEGKILIEITDYQIKKVHETEIKLGQLAGDKQTFYKIAWVSCDLIPGAIKQKEGTILVLKGQSKFAGTMIQTLKNQGKEIIEVSLGEAYCQFDQATFIIDNTENSYRKLIEILKGHNLTRIIHLQTIGNHQEIADIHQLEESQQKGVYSLFYLARALLANGIKAELDIVLIADNVHEVTGAEETLNPHPASLFGLGKVIIQEYSNLHCRCIDIDANTGMNEVLPEIEYGTGVYQVAYRNGRRYVEELQEIEFDHFPSHEILIHSKGVYIITGGTGGIGLEFGKYIAAKNSHASAPVKLALFNRSGMPERKTWNEIIAKNEDRLLIKKIRAIQEMEQSGAEVNCYSVDVSNEDALKRALAELRRKYDRINGIIHGAGVAGAGLITQKEAKVFEGVLAPKIQGTWLLDKCTENDDLDFFILFSSTTSLLGEPGQGDYTAANAFLDAYAFQRHKKGKKTITINWPAWKETGMAFDYGVNTDGIFEAIDTRKALLGFSELLNKDIPQAFFGVLNHQPGITEEFPIEIYAVIKAALHPTNRRLKIQSSMILKSEILLQGKRDGRYTSEEKELAAIWAEVLGLEAIDIYDSFYDLGGDSIMALKVANLIHQQLHKKINAGDIFEYLNINALAGYLAESALMPGETEPNFDVSESNEEKQYDLSHAQKRLWFLQKYDPGMIAYNLPQLRYFDEAMEIEALNKALRNLIKRHGSLRTVFCEENGVAYQCILTEVDSNLEMIDLSGEPEPEKTLQGLVERDNGLPFDFTSILYRIKLYKLSLVRYCLYLNIHHIITDGWSISIFFNELLEIYHAYAQGTPLQLPPIKSRYVDWIVNQKKLEDSEDFSKAEAYWLGELAKPLPVLNLTNDFPRPQYQTYYGSFLKFTIDQETTFQLKKNAREWNLTMHMLLLSAYFLLLHKLTEDMDIIIGIPTTERGAPEWEQVIGLFVNTLCIRLRFEQIFTLGELFDAVKKKSLKAYIHKNYPYELVMEKVNPERDLSRSPIFSSMFYYSSSIPQGNNLNTSIFDISILCEDTNELNITIEYNTDLFKKQTIERYGGYLINVLNQIHNPATSIADLKIISNEEKEWILSQFDHCHQSELEVLTIPQLFENQVYQNPLNIAILDEVQTLTYQTLNEKANQIAHLLRQKGVQPNEPIGIMVQRNMNTVISILAVLKSGGAYVPLDPDYPASRVRYMVEHSQAKVIITENQLLNLLPEILSVKSEVKAIIDLTGYNSVTFKINAEYYQVEDIAAQSTANLAPVSGSHDLMYIIYTSGSTGVPKGVMVTHENVQNFIRWSIKDGAITAKDRLMLVTSISFDISVFEIFGALLSGASLAIVSAEKLQDIYQLLEYVQKKKITIWHSVPTLMAHAVMISRQSGDHSRFKLEKIRRVMIGGEAWSVELAKEIKKCFPNAVLMNMYGPTETTIWVTSYQIGEELDQLITLPIGRPVVNNQVLILDAHQNLCGIGIPGDIYISGLNITPGYFKDEVKTKEVFIEKSGAVLYQTGDIGRYLDNGNIEFLGRKDGMVKVHGYRIEVGEIESVLLKNINIREVAVVIQKHNGVNGLVCFYISNRIDLENELREYIQSKLPHYMVPAHFVRLEKMPLTPNGKIDKKALAGFEIGKQPGVEVLNQTPLTQVEELLVDLWRQLLGKQEIGIHDNFFHRGGNSFLVTQMQISIEKVYPNIVRIVDIFKYPTISQLARYITLGFEDEPQLGTKDELDQKIDDLLDRTKNKSGSLAEIIQEIEDL